MDDTRTKKHLNVALRQGATIYNVEDYSEGGNIMISKEVESILEGFYAYLKGPDRGFALLVSQSSLLNAKFDCNWHRKDAVEIKYPYSLASNAISVNLERFDYMTIRNNC